MLQIITGAVRSKEPIGVERENVVGAPHNDDFYVSLLSFRLVKNLKSSPTHWNGVGDV